MNKKLIIGGASVFIGSTVLFKGVDQLKLVVGSLLSGRLELSSLIAGIIFIAVILFASYLILKGNEYLKR